MVGMGEAVLAAHGVLKGGGGQRWCVQRQRYGRWYAVVAVNVQVRAAGSCWAVRGSGSAK